MDKVLTAEELIEISKKRGRKEPYELGYEVKDKKSYRQIRVS